MRNVGKNPTEESPLRETGHHADFAAYSNYTPGKMEDSVALPPGRGHLRGLVPSNHFSFSVYGAPGPESQ